LKHDTIKKLTFAAMFAAIITVMTAFIKVNTGIDNGYIHFGDAMIYLAASTLPAPFAIAAAAIGGSFADILAGAAVWAPATAIIKALNVLPFLFVSGKIASKKSVAVSLLSGCITVFGYFIAESMLYSVASAAVSVPFSLLQAGGSTVLFAVFGTALDKVHIKNLIPGGK